MIYIEIPMKVTVEANNSSHWTKKHKRKKALQRAVGIFLSGKEFPLPCIVTLERIGPRTIDADDNLPHSFKGIKDIIAKIIIETSNLPLDQRSRPMGYHDSDPRISWAYTQRKGPHGFSIKIEPRENQHALY